MNFESYKHQIQIIDQLIDKNNEYQNNLKELLLQIENKIIHHQKIIIHINKVQQIQKNRYLKPWICQIPFYQFDCQMNFLPSNLLLQKFLNKKGQAKTEQLTSKEDVFNKIMNQTLNNTLNQTDNFDFISDLESSCNLIVQDSKPINNSDQIKNYILQNDIKNDENWFNLKKQIQKEFQTKLEVIQIYQIYIEAKGLYNESKIWTNAEDSMVKNSVKIYGQKKNSWNQIANNLDGKSPYQCYQRWFKYLDPEIQKGKWSLFQDLKLVILTQMQQGDIKWVKVAKYLQNRTDVQVRERYCNILSTSLSQQKWNIQEIQSLLALVKRYGKKWSLIAKQINGKTDNQCSRKYHQLSKFQIKLDDYVDQIQKATDKLTDNQDVFIIQKRKKLK